MDNNSFEIDYVLTSGELTWVKARGTEFFILNGRWFRNDCKEYLESVSLLDPTCLILTFDGKKVYWLDDGATIVEVGTSRTHYPATWSGSNV